jgi:hypothetical protein
MPCRNMPGEKKRQQVSGKMSPGKKKTVMPRGFDITVQKWTNKEKTTRGQEGRGTRRGNVITHGFKFSRALWDVACDFGCISDAVAGNTTPFPEGLAVSTREGCGSLGEASSAVTGEGSLVGALRKRSVRFPPFVPKVALCGVSTPPRPVARRREILAWSRCCVVCLSFLRSSLIWPRSWAFSEARFMDTS